MTSQEREQDLLMMLRFFRGQETKIRKELRQIRNAKNIQECNNQPTTLFNIPDEITQPIQCQISQARSNNRHKRKRVNY